MMTGKHIAENWTGKRFEHDLKFTQIDRDYISGGSGGMIFTLQFIPMLTNRPLRKVTGSGAITEEGEIVRVFGIHEKIQAAKETKYTQFIITKNQYIERDISVIFNIKSHIMDEAWAYASHCSCKACIWRRSKD